MNSMDRERVENCRFHVFFADRTHIDEHYILGVPGDRSLKI